jgi:hypothetical protein
MRHAFSRGYTHHASKNTNELSTHGPRALYGQSPSNLPHEIATTENAGETLSNPHLPHVLSKTPHYQCPQPQQ